MKYDLSETILALKPGAKWALTGGVYSGLE